MTRLLSSLLVAAAAGCHQGLEVGEFRAHPDASLAIEVEAGADTGGADTSTPDTTSADASTPDTTSAEVAVSDANAGDGNGADRALDAAGDTAETGASPLWFEPPELVFGCVRSTPAIVSTNPTKTVVLHNDSGVNVSAFNLEVRGAAASFFVFDSACGDTLKIGARCSVAVTFAPKMCSMQCPGVAYTASLFATVGGLPITSAPLNGSYSCS